MEGMFYKVKHFIFLITLILIIKIQILLLIFHAYQLINITAQMSVSATKLHLKKCKQPVPWFLGDHVLRIIQLRLSAWQQPKYPSTVR